MSLWHETVGVETSKFLTWRGQVCSGLYGGLQRQAGGPAVDPGQSIREFVPLWQRLLLPGVVAGSLELGLHHRQTQPAVVQAQHQHQWSDCLPVRGHR